MAYIKEASQQEQSQFQFLFKYVKDHMGFVPSSMRTMARVPAILGNFSLFSGIVLGSKENISLPVILKLMIRNAFWSSRFMRSNDRIPLYLRNLVAHITSHASGCQYCQAHTISAAKINGASEEQLRDIWSFPVSSAFNDKERAALNFGLAAGSTPNAVTNEHFEELKKYYSEKQIIELGAVVSIFGFLNKWNETFATQLESYPMEIAEDYLQPEGWSIGKHK